MKSPPLTVSIIVPAHNAATTIAACLKACGKQSYPVEAVIVVDDGSTDATAFAAKQCNVHYIHQKNAGPAAARNHGARLAQSDIIAFTDSDCVPAPDWVQQLVSGFDDGVAGVGGGYTIANPESRLASMIQAEIDCRHAAFPREVNFLGSYNVAYRKSAFDTAGGFDESFTQASGEDNDLAYRILDTGAKLVYVSAARVAHYHPTDRAAYMRTQARHGFWRVKLYKKHPRRSGGDNYAGRLDLYAPIVNHALAYANPIIILTGVVLVISGYALHPAALAVFGAAVGLRVILSVLYRLNRYSLARQIARYGQGLSVSQLVYLLTERDWHRGKGLIRGVLHFIVRGKDTLA